MPRIEKYSFGRMVIEGKTYSDDVVIAGGRVFPDWWRERGHLLQEADLGDVIAEKPAILVVGKGSPGRMEVASDAREALRQKGVRVIEQPTEQAARTYNDLEAKGENVAAGFHLTC